MNMQDQKTTYIQFFAPVIEPTINTLMSVV